MKHFIFGYGSLICPKSRAITAPTLKNAPAEPVVVCHIERTWSARVDIRKAFSGLKVKPPPSLRDWTAMGVRFRRGAMCNGVLICVDEEELLRFDERELGYDRHRVDLADIHRHIDSEVLIDKSMSLWPLDSNDVEKCDKSSFRDELDVENVKCSECRLVFEKASAKRRKIISRSSACDSSEDSEEVAVWVYVQRFR